MGGYSPRRAADPDATTFRYGSVCGPLEPFNERTRRRAIMAAWYKAKHDRVGKSLHRIELELERLSR